MENLTIADLTITSRYQVYDINLGHYIFSYLDPSASGDIPPDIAILPVKGLRTIGNVLIIDTIS